MNQQTFPNTMLPAMPADPMAEKTVEVMQDFSMMELFFQAEPLVKIVMLSLFIASIWSWAIIIHKIIRLRVVNQAMDQFENVFWSGGSLKELHRKILKQPLTPITAIFAAAMKEWESLSSQRNFPGTTEQRIERVMQVTLNKEMEELERYMTFLSSLGTNAVIIGLFGTVIGIMNSFENIAAQQNTNLAVVAPGIAEALFATAIGLIAAIPAAIAYNKLSSDLNRFANRLNFFCSDFISIVARETEHAM